MKFKVQNLIFPETAKHNQSKALFYKGDFGYFHDGVLSLAKYQTADFTSYFNSCTFRKWKKYTGAITVELFLEIEGDFSINYVGYSKEIASINRTEFHKEEYHLNKKGTVYFRFPENNEQMVGFEICSLNEVKLYGGGYSLVFNENKQVNDVCLSIATTTCKKELFIKNNIELLKKEILEKDIPEKNDIYVQVVDNGRTLTENDIYGSHIRLFSNLNSGGSGGFARGMIESLRLERKATHVLLMDDDILILPESILRTYYLLKLIKCEYADRFISGAMLYYEEPDFQHEDIGTVTSNCAFESLKPKYDHTLLKNNLENESEFVKQKNEYAGWWYCCIPARIIEKNGLPLPLFIRCDDIEYSLRCHANIITMNGICVWHMGFVTKYNAAFDKYQQCRNLLIGKACSDILQNVNVKDFVMKSFRAEMLKFNYNGAELVLRAIEDYVKGPDQIKLNNGESIVKENSKLNDVMIPLDKIDDIDIRDPFLCYYDPPRRFLDTWLFRITYNGQRFWNDKICKKGYAYIAFDHTYQPQKMAMHSKLVAINPYNNTGIVRCINKKRYKELIYRFRRVWRYLNKNESALIKKYKNDKDYLVSIDFWNKYLEI